MPRYIAKIDGKYCEWSTIVDAPVTYLMPLLEFVEHYRAEYGADGMRGLDERMERVEKYGTSSRVHRDIKDLIAGNHAGPNGTELTLAEIAKQYGEAVAQ